MRIRLRGTLVMVVAGLLAGLLAGPVTADVTLYVRADAPPGGDGLSWETAHRTVQRALDRARAPEGVCKIRVAQGTYEPDETGDDPAGTGNRDAVFELVGDVPLSGGYAGTGPDPDARDVAKFETVLSGDLLGDDGPDFTNYDDNSYLVVRAVGPGVLTIEGFTIRGANGRGEQENEYEDGGMFSAGEDTQILVCTFEANSTGFLGGGLYTFDGRVHACRFIGNRAWRGGGLSQQGSTTIAKCSFEDNRAEDAGGGAQLNGIVTVDRSRFVGNTAPYGGGAWIDFNASPRGAVMLVANSVFAGNDALRGGGLFLGQSTRITNCTLVDNGASEGGGGIGFPDGLNYSWVANCVISGNDDPQVQGFAGSGEEPFEVTYSIVEGGYPGDGNLDADPLLTDDFRLHPGSPAIDAGRSAALEIGRVLDLHGQPRFHDDPGTPNTGVPDESGPIDIGATEFQGATCAGDVDASGTVDFDDVLRVLSAWGPCPREGPCAEDVDRNGDVDLGDLLVVLSGWGPCPS